MKKLFLILISTVFFGSIFAQNNFDFPKDMLGKWKTVSGNEYSFEIWVQVSQNAIEIRNCKIFDSDTIVVTLKKIVFENNNYSLYHYDILTNDYLPYKFDLQLIEKNFYSFTSNMQNSEVNAFNYIIEDQNKVYFFLETIDDEYFNVDYLMFRDE